MRKSNILIVDDSPDNLFLMEVILKNHNFNIISATNGVEAVEAVKRNIVDTILMDIMMPEMDGFEATRKIREMKASEHIPIILITAKKRERDDVIRGLGEGALEYITKPFDDEELVARVKSMLRMKHIHDHNLELLAKVRTQQEQMETELRMAESVQKQMLPSREFLSRFNNCNIAAHYLAASNIGGDIYDIFSYGENRTAFLIADVTGHGPAAALIMAMLKAMVANERSDYPSPSELARRLNIKLKKMIPESHFVTLFFGVADFSRKKLDYVTAGHPPPFLIGRKDDSLQVLNNTGTMLGIFEETDAVFENDCVKFKAGDKLVFFSDGLYETMDERGKIYGLPRLKEFVYSKKDCSAKKMADSILADVNTYWDGKTELDDIAVVVVEFK